MYKRIKDIEGMRLEAKDGRLGAIGDALFDDQNWTIRYLLVETGRWLPGRRVLIAPASVLDVDLEDKSIRVGLTTDQVEKAPGLDKHEPVSRQHEQELVTYYGWPVYWGGLGGVIGTDAYLGPPPAAPPPPQWAGEKDRPASELETEKQQGDPNLRSAQEIRGYHVQASDGEMGHIAHLVLDTESWTVRYLVVDTRNWLPGREVLVSPSWIRGIDWFNALIKTDLTRGEIKECPPYDSVEQLDRDYETRLHNHYQRPRYWE